MLCCWEIELNEGWKEGELEKEWDKQKQIQRAGEAYRRWKSGESERENVKECGHVMALCSPASLFSCWSSRDHLCWGHWLEWLWRDYIFAVAMPTNQLTLPPPNPPSSPSLSSSSSSSSSGCPQQQNIGATSSAALNSAKCFSHPVFFFSVIANGLWPLHVFSILLFCVCESSSQEFPFSWPSVQVYNINTFH